VCRERLEETPVLLIHVSTIWRTAGTS
jgi:hypothetical protein